MGDINNDSKPDVDRFRTRPLHRLRRQPIETPLLGDWNHDGRTKVGTFLNGTFILDNDGRGTFNAADKFYTYLSHTSADKPVVGDWSGTGITKDRDFSQRMLDTRLQRRRSLCGTGPTQDHVYDFNGNAGEQTVTKENYFLFNQVYPLRNLQANANLNELPW